MSNEKEESGDAQRPRTDRRRRHLDDPATPITVNMPVALRDALDAVVIARNGTRSGFICMAIAAWLDREEKVHNA